MSEKALTTQQIYQPVRDFYDRTAEDYQERYHSAEEFRAQLRDFILSLPPHAAVLDCGSGPGKEACVIAKSARKVVALDLSANMLTKVKENNPLIEIVQANMNTLPFATSSFDALWCSRALIHIPQEDLAQTLTEFYRVVKRDGMVGLLFHIPAETATQSKHLGYYKHLYSEVYMRDVLTRIGFTIEKKEPGLNQYYEFSLQYMRARKVN